MSTNIHTILYKCIFQFPLMGGCKIHGFHHGCVIPWIIRSDALVQGKSWYGSLQWWYTISGRFSTMIRIGCSHTAQIHIKNMYTFISFDKLWYCIRYTCVVFGRRAIAGNIDGDESRRKTTGDSDKSGRRPSIVVTELSRRFSAVKIVKTNK